MPLTPDDVRSKQFTPVRLREGYDVTEVDSFLDEVEAELERLLAENEELRAKLAAAQRAGADQQRPVDQTAALPPVVQQPKPPVVVEKPEEPKPPVPVPGAAAAAGTVGDASSSAVRLLEMATKHSDDLVQEAKDTADKIIGEARAKAERLENEARGKADRMTGEARARAEKLDGEIAERRAQMLGTLEKQKGQLERTIDDLHAYEREYRSRLKTYFTEQLKALGNGDDTLSPRNGFRPEARAQAHGGHGV
ncbi:DivIVA domain-containing protein [Kribbella sp. NPDC004536]|uniref:DivIVA domain-containing protein n=1 Tax=Kribbella sp. NPDC004536 TaxID=3364106 RepID=UPI003684C93C